MRGESPGGYPLLTSETVVDESVYVIIRKLFSLKGVKNRFEVKKRLHTPEGQEVIDEAIELVMGLIEEADVAILTDADVYITIATMKKYSLLPHDARIVATMLQNGVKRLATFDDDFRPIPGLVLLPKDYWDSR
ncbi:PIN domain-containing protein [Thermococcus sp. JdF3]|uniref:PIN domain-containing protein n=1 Tax=Thermococcus sp. JdF3 TaxID=1638258 RepID=UPI0016A1DE13|nr:PIN domain-containing protein [Thermococcus sp. JdF3]